MFITEMVSFLKKIYVYNQMDSRRVLFDLHNNDNMLCILKSKDN